MSTTAKDFQYAIRTLRTSPMFSTVAILSLALGIGANTAIFTLLDQLVLRPIPVKNPTELAALKTEGHHYGSNWGMNALSYPMYKDFSEHNAVFSGMLCRFAVPSSLGFGNKTERVNAELVSGTYFPLLGVGASVGRTFTPSDDRLPGAHPIAVLSHEFWQRRFGGDRAIVGRTLVINGRQMTVVGVAQPGFDGVQLEYQAQVWIPVMMKAQMTPFWDGLKDRRQRWVNVFGRLKPGVSLNQAQTALQPFMHAMLLSEVIEAAFAHASTYDRQQFLRSWIHVLPGDKGISYVRGTLTTPMWMLLAITAGVLLIACTNLASLLLAKATARQKEMAIRLAVGASRAQIIRQLLIESFLLAVAGAALGLVVSIAVDQILLATFVQVDAGDFSVKLSPIPDGRILLFTLVVMVLTTVLFGLAPALRASTPELAPTLKDEAGSVIGGARASARKALVAFQVALSLLLLIAAGLFIRTLVNLRQLGPGFPIEHLIAFNLDPSLNGYTADQSKIFYKRLSQELASLPGVASVGLASMRILEGDEWDSSMTVEGYQGKGDDRPDPFMNSIGPNYFSTLGVPVLRGRDFTEADTSEVKRGPKDDDWAPARVMINESFAKKYFRKLDPVGRHVGFGSDPGTKTDMEIIGVVKDIKYTNLRDDIPVQAFVPYLANRFTGGMTVYLRTAMDEKEVMPAVRRKVQALDRNVPMFSLRTTEEQIALSLRTERFVASLSSAFGFLATLLAVIGLYGVMAFTVSRRTREIGIRMALGAMRGNVVWMVMREVLILITIGVVVGVGTGIGLTQFVRTLLFGLSPADPSTIAIATLLAVTASGLAGLIPALRASQVSPTRALRYE